MNIVVIIQARMGSTRLPGKILTDIAGKTMIERTIERVKRSKQVTEVIVATTNTEADNVTEEECKRLGVRYLRGSEEDVLDRYYQAAQETNADVIVRITADCPLIDPDVLNTVITEFIKQQPDYASNILERTYPRGLDAEVISIKALEKVWREAKKKYEREHVTPFIYENPSLFTIISIKNEKDYSGYRWTVDTPEDLAFVRTIYESFNNDSFIKWKDITKFLEKNPEINQLNEDIEQKALKS